MKEVRCVKVEEINKEDAHSLRIVLSKSSSAFVFFCARLQSSTLTLTQTPKMQEEKTHTHTSEGPLNSVFFLPVLQCSICALLHVRADP